MKRLLPTLLLILSAMPASAYAGGMFAQGRTQFSLFAGNGYAFDNNYFLFGGSASHYVLDGLGLGFSFENWSGGGPGITKYAPFVQYVFNRESSVQGYVGMFYRHTAIKGLPGINSIGERAGVNVASGPNAYVSIGFVQEDYLNCQESVYRVCKETYPDLGFTFGF